LALNIGGLKMAEQDEHKEIEKKRGKDPLAGITGGLIVILLGVLFLLRNMGYLHWGNWWAYFLVGIGVFLILEAIVRSAIPQYRCGILGRVIGGIVLIFIGAGNIYGIGHYWPLILVGVGIAIIVATMFGFKKSGKCSKS